MEFTSQQEEALEKVRRWRADPADQVFRLFGYAGTGKTTLAREIGADFFAAYTGKAAHVLKEKGCPAQTIHSLIYHPVEKSRERLTQLSKQLIEMVEDDPRREKLMEEIRKERDQVTRPGFTLNLDSALRDAQLLVIDECSMVDARIGEDLLSFGVPILVLGDPAQLPPVKGGGYFTDHEPDVLLTEIHRQARDNPILDLATRIRQREDIPKGHPCLVEKATLDLVLAADQLLVGRNETRRKSNRRIREALGRTSPLPEEGDKVVCLRNNHDLGLLNGALFSVESAEHYGDLVQLRLDSGLETLVHAGPFRGEEVDMWRLRDAEMFDFGYALTVHKAQGSQWDRVGVIDESGAFRGHQRRWLYTAVTRAAKELWVG